MSSVANIHNPSVNIPQRSAIARSINIGKKLLREDLCRDINALIGTDVCWNQLTVVTLTERKYFCINGFGQKSFDEPFVRQLFQDNAQHPSDVQYIQVLSDVGDFIARNAFFTCQERIRDILAPRNKVLLWNLTGSTRKVDNIAADAINEWVDEDILHHRRALALITDTHTLTGLQQGCNIPMQNTNFFIVSGETSLGSSHYIANQLTDEGVCFEGGYDSFERMIDLLSNDVPLRCYYGLRISYVSAFSAVRFFKLFVDYAEQKKISCADISLENAQEILTTYERTSPFTHSEQHIPLFQRFISEMLWTKLTNCKFYDMQPAKSWGCAVM